MKRYILLDSIRSMQNVWAIFRNADGSGYDKLILTGHTPYPTRNDISKTALWSEKYIDWEYYFDPIEILQKLKQEKYMIISVELTDKSIDYRDFWDLDRDYCLVVGNEIDWVKQEILQLSDKIVMIPMLGKKASLNVSVAAGIVMYGLL